MKGRSYQVAIKVSLLLYCEFDTDLNDTVKMVIMINWVFVS